MILQAAMLFYQMLLYREVAGHAALYDGVVKLHCNATSAGSCKSRLWREYLHADRIFDGVQDIRQPIPVTFSTTSRTPLAVQIVVIPNPEYLHIPYEMLLKRHARGDLSEKIFYEYRTTGVSSVILTEEENGRSGGLITSPIGMHSPSEMAVWEGTIVLSDIPKGPSSLHSSPRYHAAVAQLHKFQKELKSVKIIANEINNVEMAEFNNSIKNCEFEKTWSNVMTHSMSQGSSRLAWTSTWLLVSIVASVVVTFFVWTWFSGRRTIEGLNFHYIVVAKCVLQDMPLQIISLYYIFSWYEGGGGERCQLCLLDVAHCERMSPFHFSNFILITLTIASSLSNQFLFSSDPTQVKTEDDASFLWFARFVLGCLTLLPFSTAMVAFNGSLLDLPGLIHMIFLVPCFTGWVALFSLMCLPITTCLDNDDLYVY